MKKANRKHFRKRRGAGVLWKALALAAACAMIWSASTAMVAASAPYEGQGYGSPEDAVRAYLEGMQNGDLSQMLAAFAIESYAARYDFQGQLEWTKVYLPSVPGTLPNASPLFQAINVETRKAEVVRDVMYQLLAFNMPDTVDSAAPVVFAGDDAAAQVAQFVQHMEEATHNLALASLQITGFVPPESLHDMYTDPKNRENVDRKRQIIGADEIRSVAMQFTAEGRSCILCCDVARYGEAWYLISFGGNIGNLLGIPATHGGIMLAP